MTRAAALLGTVAALLAANLLARDAKGTTSAAPAATVATPSGKTVK